MNTTPVTVTLSPAAASELADLITDYMEEFDPEETAETELDALQERLQVAPETVTTLPAYVVSAAYELAEELAEGETETDMAELRDTLSNVLPE